MKGKNKNKLIFIFTFLVAIAIIITIIPSIIARSNKEVVLDDDGNEMFTVQAKLYDYKSDSEIINGSINNYYNGASGRINHYGFSKINSEISNYYKDNSMNYPLYFGDFNGSQPAEAKYNFFWVANRANRNNYDAAVQGLVDQELTDNNISDNGVALPYFNDNYLKETTVNGKSIGEVVETNFPFRQLDENGVEYYEFDSKNGKDNVWLEDDALKYSGNKDTHGIWDALHVMVSSTSKDGIGFFPFNKAEDQKDSRSNLNFGFGLRLDIDFKIPTGGVVLDNDGVPQDVIFEFTGDDDVWIFIDGKLVLDLGGQHKESNGKINFSSTGGKTEQAVVSRYVNINDDKNNLQSSTSKNKVIYLSDLGLNFDDPTEKHTLTMFYMERGMIESNLKLKFNFINTDPLTIEKKVDTTAVNSGVIDIVNNIVSNEEFKFNILKEETDLMEPVKDVVYHDKDNIDNVFKTDNEGGFSLKDKQSILFTGKFDKDDIIQIKEEENERYDTSIKIYDDGSSKPVNNIIGVDTGKIDFTTVGEDNPNKVVEFNNKVRVAPISIKKEVSTYVENKFEGYENHKFVFQIKLKNLFGDETDTELSTYNLKYSIDGNVYEAIDGKITLKANQTAIIEGIPVGTYYEISEIEMDERYKLQDCTNISGIVSDQVETIATFVNGAKEEMYELKITKNINERYYPGNDDFSINETYEGLTDAEQSFLFKITQYDKPIGDKDRKELRVLYEVISFKKGDDVTKSRLITNLPMGYYDVEEITDWSWKYEFKSVNVVVHESDSDEAVEIDNKNHSANNIDLGYNIIKTPEVIFVNNKKYLNEEHSKIPEGDTAITTNKLSK